MAAVKENLDEHYIKAAFVKITTVKMTLTTTVNVFSYTVCMVFLALGNGNILDIYQSTAEVRSTFSLP